MNQPNQASKEAGFSLTEILVVVVIIGVLVMLAMPKFSGIIADVKTTEAKTSLKHLHTLQQAHYYEHDRYGSTLNEIRFDQNTLVTDGGDARYRFEILAADGISFTAQAIAVVDFDKDGIYNVWQIGEAGRLTEVTPD